jgi:hypothetical protein
LILLASVLALLPAAPVHAGTCSNPTGAEADIIYNNDYHTFQFCDGSNWMAFGGGKSCAPASPGYHPTVPSGNGYFVLSKGTYNGAFQNYSASGGVGDLAGADAICLSEVTTNTGWKGYSTANTSGQLIASKVHAFLCDEHTCTNLMPLTTYYFANAGNSSAGGASFTTDSNGVGPNDSADWSAANYFSGSYTYWMDMTATSNTAWSNITTGYGCGNWVNGSVQNGGYGQSAQTTSARWYANINACSNAYNLICVVNP